MGAVLVIARTHSGSVLYAGAVNQAKAVSCHGLHASHRVILRNEAPDPKSTEARVCDTLTFANQDNTARLIAFGAHENHIDYSGFGEQYLYGGKEIKMVLLEPGKYGFHDHIRDVLQGEITVKR
jgi:hypothetical protein